MKLGPHKVPSTVKVVTTLLTVLAILLAPLVQLFVRLLADYRRDDAALAAQRLHPACVLALNYATLSRMQDYKQLVRAQAMVESHRRMSRWVLVLRP